MTAAVRINQFDNPIWRLHNLYTIVDKDGKRVPFRPNAAQQQFLEGMGRRNVILKARQLGFTTLCCLLYLDDCLFNKDVRASLIAHRLGDAKAIFRDKVKLPYDVLPEGIRNMVGTVADSADTLTFSNNSSFSVSTSTRGGTVNWLHISEHGKIAAQYPEKAREIKTGAFPSAERGVITIESTAEGDAGDFFDICQEAQEVERQGREPHPTDWRFFFFPWLAQPTYRLPQTVVPITPEDERYFLKIEAETGRILDEAQRNWYVREQKRLGGDMKREYPATPREAFEQALEGAYFADQLAFAERHERITDLPIRPERLVHTAWDLGRNDLTSIWLWQDGDGGLSDFVGYYEASGEYIAHYADWLRGWAVEHGVMFGNHYMPHDAKRDLLWLEGGTQDVLKKVGLRVSVVPVTPNKIEAIQVARRHLMMARFDRARCAQGLKRLRAYRKKWNDVLGTWSNEPLHDDNSNAADGFMTYAQSGHKPVQVPLPGQARGDRYSRGKGRRSGGRSAWSA